MRKSFIYRFHFGLALAASGCAQQPIAAEDAPLAQQTAPAADVVAAVAFGFGDAAVLRDVGIIGSIATGFRLTEVPPPPEAELALTDWLESPVDDPGFLTAPLVAVPRGHAEKLQSMKGSYHSSCRDGRCSESARVCTPDAAACTSVEVSCDRWSEDCRITAIDGDPELLRRSLRLFAGRNPDYQLLYVTADASHESLVSQTYASGQPLVAGWHLLQRREVGEAERRRQATCDTAVEVAVFAQYTKELGRNFRDLDDLNEYLLLTRYNAINGTAFTRLEELDPSSPGFDAAFEAMIRDYERRRIGETLLRHCAGVGVSWAVVGGPGARELTIDLSGPGSAPQVGDLLPNGSPWRGSSNETDWGW